MAAAAACLARGVEREAVAAGLRTFPGVAHRLDTRFALPSGKKLELGGSTAK